VAKGARRPKSPFAGKLDLFFAAEIEVHLSRNADKDLHILKDILIRSPRLGLRRNYLQTLAASYFVKWIDLVSEPDHASPDLADLLERALDFLDREDADLRATLHFEKQLAECLGIDEPGVSAHVSLGNVFHRVPSQRADLMERFG
ncbi:MAG: hypothetical protein AAF236_10400, partial [Verrucomicrobiota bacterium]